jgi:hypothetical protein
MVAVLGGLLAAPFASAQVSFGPSREIVETISYGLGLVTPADMDGDGDLDVIAAEQYGVRVLWWENDGAGNFSNRREWRWMDSDTSQATQWRVIGLSDQNGDDRPDIWLLHTESEVNDIINYRYLVAKSQSDGSFAAPEVVLEAASSSWPEAMLISDLDGNGRPDIVTPNAIYLADGDGAFSGSPISLPSNPVKPGLELWERRKEVHFVDADADGRTDLVIHSEELDEQAHVLRNLGAAGFATPVPLLPDNPEDQIDIDWICLVPRGFGTPTQLYALEKDQEGSATLRVFEIAADFSVTPKASLALPKTNDGFQIYWSGLQSEPRMGRVFLWSESYVSASQFPRSVMHEVTLTGSILTLAQVETHRGLTIPLPASIQDLNGDTVPDLLCSSSIAWGMVDSGPDQILWQQGRPDGSGFLAETKMVTRSLFSPWIHSTTDIDGDGDTDLLLGSSGFFVRGRNQLEVLKNRGESEGFERLPISHSRHDLKVVATIDLSGEFLIMPPNGAEYLIQCSSGKPDFLVQTFEYDAPFGGGTLRFEWLLQDANGTFHLKPLISESAIGLGLAGYEDWDGDGTKDLLYQTSDFLKWCRGTGSTFAAPVALVSSIETIDEQGNPLITDSRLHLVDIDWDGDLDLLGGGWLFGDYSGYWFENNGSGGIFTIHRLASGMGIVPDLDGDGHRDFLMNNELLLARPNVAFETRQIPFDFLYGMHDFADLDGDGDADLIRSLTPIGITGYQSLEWWENRGDGSFVNGSGSNAGLPIAPPRWAGREKMLADDLNGDGRPDLIVTSSELPRVEWFPATAVEESPQFGTWMEANGLRGHSAGPQADWDGDGSANWEEFAFGSDAAQSDPAHPGRPRIEAGVNGLSFTFQRRTDAEAAGLSYQTEYSTDLSEWLPWFPTATTSPAAESYEQVRFPITPSQQKEFFRVGLSDSSSSGE